MVKRLKKSFPGIESLLKALNSTLNSGGNPVLKGGHGSITAIRFFTDTEKEFLKNCS